MVTIDASLDAMYGGPCGAARTALLATRAKSLPALTYRWADTAWTRSACVPKRR